MFYFYEENISVSEYAYLDRNARTSLRIFKCISNISCHVDCTRIPYWRSAKCRFQMPRGLKRGSVAVRSQGLWVRIPQGTRLSRLLWVLCVVRYMSLRQADHSSRGVIPNLVSRCVIVKRWWWGALDPLGAVALGDGGGLWGRWEYFSSDNFQCMFYIEDIIKNAKYSIRFNC